MMPKLNNSILEPAAVHTTATLVRRSWRRGALCLVLGMTATGLSGCTILGGLQQKIQHCDCVDDFMIGHRNRVMATRAWLRVKHLYRGHCFLKDFRNGFIAGYIDVANGGAGCTPTVVSSKYWGWRYQSGTGQAAVNAWYEGFPHGAKAAEEDGIGNFNLIQLNGTPRTTMNMNGSASPTPAVDDATPLKGTALPPGVMLEEGETLVPGGLSIQDRGSATQDREPGTTQSKRPRTAPEFVPAPVEVPEQATPPTRSELDSEFERGQPAEVKVDPFLNDLSGRNPSGKSAETTLTSQEMQFWNEISGGRSYSRSASTEVNAPARNEGLDLVPRTTKPASTEVSSSKNSGAASSVPPRSVSEPSQAEIDAVIEEIFGKSAGGSR